MKTTITVLLFLYSNLAYSAVPPQAVGSYANGTLKNAEKLKPQVTGLLKLFVSRDRGWGTGQTVTFLNFLGKYNNWQWPQSERLQVGDVSAQNGGSISGHTSHQNGLDMDVVYLRTVPYEQPIETESFVESFVIDEVGLSENFDKKRNWQLIKALYKTNVINRIFVDPVIKFALCDYASQISEKDLFAEVLRVLRPWPNHKDHMHIRLKCPTTSPECVVQEAPPPGHGCDQNQVSESTSTEHDG